MSAPEVWFIFKFGIRFSFLGPFYSYLIIIICVKSLIWIFQISKLSKFCYNKCSKSVIILNKVLIVLFSDKSYFKVFILFGFDLVLNSLDSSLLLLMIDGRHFCNFSISLTMPFKFFFQSIVMFLRVVKPFPFLNVSSSVFWSLN